MKTSLFFVYFTFIVLLIVNDAESSAWLPEPGSYKVLGELIYDWKQEYSRRVELSSSIEDSLYLSLRGYRAGIKERCEYGINNKLAIYIEYILWFYKYKFEAIRTIKPEPINRLIARQTSITSSLVSGVNHYMDQEIGFITSVKQDGYDVVSVYSGISPGTKNMHLYNIGFWSEQYLALGISFGRSLPILANNLGYYIEIQSDVRFGLNRGYRRFNADMTLGVKFTQLLEASVQLQFTRNKVKVTNNNMHEVISDLSYKTDDDLKKIIIDRNVADFLFCKKYNELFKISLKGIYNISSRSSIYLGFSTKMDSGFMKVGSTQLGLEIRF